MTVKRNFDGVLRNIRFLLVYSGVVLLFLKINPVRKDGALNPLSNGVKD